MRDDAGLLTRSLACLGAALAPLPARDEAAGFDGLVEFNGLDGLDGHDGRDGLAAAEESRAASLCRTRNEAASLLGLCARLRRLAGEAASPAERNLFAAAENALRPLAASLERFGRDDDRQG